MTPPSRKKARPVRKQRDERRRHALEEYMQSLVNTPSRHYPGPDDGFISGWDACEAILADRVAKLEAVVTSVRATERCPEGVQCVTCMALSALDESRDK